MSGAEENATTGHAPVPRSGKPAVRGDGLPGKDRTDGRPGPGDLSGHRAGEGGPVGLNSRLDAGADQPRWNPTRSPAAGTSRGPGSPRRTRSTRYHRPRAPFCGVGYCTNCLVRVNGVPNVRACQDDTAPGDDSGGRERLAVRPVRRARRLRRAVPAGDRHAPRVPAPRVRRPWTLPASGPPPGRDRSRADADNGPRPEPRTIGHHRLRRRRGRGAPDGRPRRPWSPRVTGPWSSTASLEPPPFAGAERFPGTTGVFLPPAPRRGAPALRADREPVRRRGARSSRAPRCGGGGGLRRLAVVRRQRPTGGPHRRGGGAAPSGRSGPGSTTRSCSAGDRARSRCSSGSGTTWRPSWPRARSSPTSPAELPSWTFRSSRGPSCSAWSAGAASRKVRLAPRGGGQPAFSVEADAVVLAHRRLPHPQLFFQAGARMEWRPDVGAYGPTVGPSGATTVPGLAAAGESAGAATPELARASGVAAANAVLAGGAWSAPDPSPPSTPTHELEGYYQELLSTGPGPGKVVVCPCEDVLLGEVLEATDHGYRGIEVIKRYTGLGTGLCQGRYCLPDALLVLAMREQRPVSARGRVHHPTTSGRAHAAGRLGGTPGRARGHRVSALATGPVPGRDRRRRDRRTVHRVPSAQRRCRAGRRPRARVPLLRRVRTQRRRRPPAVGLAGDRPIDARGGRRSGGASAGSSGRTSGSVREATSSSRPPRRRSRRLRQVTEAVRAEGLDGRLLDPCGDPSVRPRRSRSRGSSARTFLDTDGTLYPFPGIWGVYEAVRALGGEVALGVEVTGVRTEAGRRGRARRRPQGPVDAPTVVNAAGGWSGDVSRLAGLAVPNVASRHEILATEPLKPFLDPMVIRSHGRAVLQPDDARGGRRRPVDPAPARDAGRRADLARVPPRDVPLARRARSPRSPRSGCCGPGPGTTMTPPTGSP